ncbi:hypothetical protein UY3_07793 [Chelonia mydas]|uniref:Uncharacterized protein n=1 Tax=Chelonia mydas TaxID=8469 RepID=M7BHD2_CHEMY|nr:hypothetical protein UY3_07793 [Chelonia mydas]
MVQTSGSQTRTTDCSGKALADRASLFTCRVRRFSRLWLPPAFPLARDRGPSATGNRDRLNLQTRQNILTCKFDKMQKRYNVKFLKIATALNPRFKNLKCLPKSERDETWSLLSEVLTEQHSDAEMTESKPPKKKINHLLVASDSDDENEHELVRTALDHYRAEPVISMNACTLKQWPFWGRCDHLPFFMAALYTITVYLLSLLNLLKPYSDTVSGSVIVTESREQAGNNECTHERTQETFSPKTLFKKANLQITNAVENA